MGLSKAVLVETMGHWPPVGLPMGEFRVSPYKGLSNGAPLKKYVRYTGDIPDAIVTTDGCIHSSSCFACPLSDCHYTQKKSKRSVHTRSLRDVRLVELRQEGYSIRELAELFGVTKRMVYRVLHLAKQEALHVNSG